MYALTTVVVDAMTVVVAAEVSGTTVVVVVDTPPLLDDLEDLVVLKDFADNFFVDVRPRWRVQFTRLQRKKTANHLSHG